MGPPACWAAKATQARDTATPQRVSREPFHFMFRFAPSSSSCTARSFPLWTLMKLGQEKVLIIILLDLSCKGRRHFHYRQSESEAIFVRSRRKSLRIMAVVYETILDVGDEVPGFDLESHLGRIVFRDIVYGRWCLLVTIDSAFEPVATTDLGMLARLKEEFDHREIFILVISSDTISNVRQWVADIEELNSTKLEYAIMADPTCSILRKFGCAREKDRKWKVVSNGAFLIDLDANIRYSIRTSPFVGRNWFECLRQFDATMLVTLHPVVCPCNWGQGQKVLMRKDVPVKDVTEYRAAEIKPWFRLAPCPDNI